MAKLNNIRFRADRNRWEGRVSIGRNPRTGKIEYKSLYGKTQSEVRRKMKVLSDELEKGLDGKAKRWELGAWLDHWMENYKKNEVQATTYEGYRYALMHIQSAVGKAYLQDLTTDMLQRVLNEVAQSGKQRTVKIAHTILNAALKQAVQNGLIVRNPAQAVVLPKQQRKEAKVLTEDEQQLFIQALQGERLATLFMLQLSTGMRPGEVCALTWDDVDFDNKILHITKGVRREKVDGAHSRMVFSPTKTKQQREVELLDEAIDILKQQKLLQEREKNLLGDEYTDLGLVFATHQGGILERGNISKVLNRVKLRMRQLKAVQDGVDVTEVQITDFTLHTLRHTFATRALEKDIPLKIVSAWLGHTTIRVTGDIYSHALPEKRRSSIEKLKGITGIKVASGQKRGQDAS